MNNQFTQPKKIVAVETNKQAIARKFDIKASEVVYAKADVPLYGYRAIYDQQSQFTYSLPKMQADESLVTLADGVLTTSINTYNLGALAVVREEWNKINEDFTTGFTLNEPNQIVHDGFAFYRWAGAFPKVVSAGSTVDSTGAVSSSAWVNIGIERLSITGVDKIIPSSNGGTIYSDYQFSPLVKKGEFGKQGEITQFNQAIFYPVEGLWYVTQSTTFPVVVPNVPDSTWRCVGLLNGYPVNDVRNWGLVGDDFTDNTTNFVRMLAKNKGYAVEFHFPAGIYRYIDIGAITMSRCTFKGDGSMRTVLRCMNNAAGHIALDINAWPDPNDATQPFLDAFNLTGMHIEGNSNTLKVVRMQGNSRCFWKDVSIWGARSTDGVGLSIEACSINQFDSVYVSKYRNLVGQKVNVPFYGLVITTGYRAGAFQASSTDNLFNSCGWEGVARGCLLTYADGTVMTAGTSEANTEYDLAIQVGCRFNTFINFATESVAAQFNIQDRGEYSYFKNCYANKLFYIGQNSRSSEISGGYFQQITTQTGSADAKIHDLTIGNWGATTGDGVDVSLGTGHVIYSIYNKSVPDYVNTTDTRHSASLTISAVSGGSNGVWDNSTRLPVTFYIGGSTSAFTQALILRGGAGGDSVAIPLLGVQQVHLEAKDRISLSWSSSTSAPTCSYRAKRGYN